jgi:hypothetical protein
MTWKQKTVIRILLIVAEMLADAEWRKEVRTLATHISVNAPEREIAGVIS